jgi:hypothetical protein
VRRLVLVVFTAAACCALSGCPVLAIQDRTEVLSIRPPMGDVPVVNYVWDYREVDGVRLPHKLRQVVGGQELVTTFESFTHNAEIPASQFDLPKEIHALVGKK